MNKKHVSALLSIPNYHNFIVSTYHLLLCRDPDPEGYFHYFPRGSFERGDKQNIIRAIMRSKEYAQTHSRS